VSLFLPEISRPPLRQLGLPIALQKVEKARRVHFGLGSAGVVDNIELTSGIRQALKVVTACRVT
jgi:hypothetical protein